MSLWDGYLVLFKNPKAVHMLLSVYRIINVYGLYFKMCCATCDSTKALILTLNTISQLIGMANC